MLPASETLGGTYSEGPDSFLSITTQPCVMRPVAAPNSTCERVIIPADYNYDIVWSKKRNRKVRKMVRMIDLISYPSDTYESDIKMKTHNETLRTALKSAHSGEINEEKVALWSLD